MIRTIAVFVALAIAGAEPTAPVSVEVTPKPVGGALAPTLKQHLLSLPPALWELELQRLRALKIIEKTKAIAKLRAELDDLLRRILVTVRDKELADEERFRLLRYYSKEVYRIQSEMLKLK